MAQHSTTATRGAARVTVATRVQGLEGAAVELIDLRSERHPERVLLRLGDADAAVSLIDDLATVWAVIVEADRQLARLADQRRSP
jgi:predicted mannosyl-3-phosphoglycerate phosphatase (HAD superfamily)